MFHLLKVLLFLLRVGVIKAHDKLAFECDLVVLVEQSSLGVANMEVSNRGETELVLVNKRTRSLMQTWSLMVISPKTQIKPYPLASGGKRTTTFPISAPGNSTNFPTSCFFSVVCQTERQTPF